jgi:hypothetical protein
MRYSTDPMRKNDKSMLLLFLTTNILSGVKKTHQGRGCKRIGHVVAESYANKRSMHGRRQFVVSNATLNQ